MNITTIIQQRMKTLCIEPSDALVVGSTVLAVLGMRKQGDIDIMIRESAFHRIASGGCPVTQYADGTGQMVIGDTELMYAWRGKTIDDFLPHAFQIDGIFFMSLSDIKKWKQQQDRPKDKQDIQLINTYLKATDQ